MHKIKDILRTISRQMQLSPDLLTVSSPMGANTASHEEQHYFWASVLKANCGGLTGFQA